MSEVTQKIVYIGALAAYSLLEHWLGKTSRTEAGSVIQLAINTLRKVSMEKVKIEIEAAKEITDIGLALEAVVMSAKQAAKDGFQAGQDIPAVALASWQPLIEAIKNADQISEEAKEPAAVAGAIGGMVTKITQAILAK